MSAMRKNLVFSQTPNEPVSERFTHTMIGRRALSLCLVLGCLVLPKAASADVISLTTPLSGTATVGDVYTLTVSFDPNGSLATNLVAMELYLGLTGFTPIGGTYQLGSVFSPFLADMAAIDGPCADVGCGIAAEYLALVSVFAPFEPTGPGSLFSMQLSAASAAFAFDLFGDDAFALFWDPPGDDAVMEAVPFVIAAAGDVIAPGIARINVSLTGPPPPTDPTDPTPVPEPGTIALFATGLAGAVMRLRRPSPRLRPDLAEARSAQAGRRVAR